MKKLIIGLAVALSFTTAQAETKSNEDVCQSVSELAEMIMDIRQMGGSAQELMEINGSHPLARSLVLEAFAEPAYNTEEYQKKASREFKSKTYLECSVALSKKK